MTTETILTEEKVREILSKTYGCSPIDVLFHDVIAANDIEQAVLQSPEVQALRKDAEAFRTMVSKRLTVCVRELGHEVEVFRDGECLSWPACGAHANDKERTAVARQAIVMAVAAMEQQK